MKSRSASVTTQNPDAPAADRIQYGGKSLKRLKDDLINSDPKTYSAEKLQLIISNDGLKVQTTTVSGQPSNTKLTKAVVHKTLNRRLRKSTCVKSPKPITKRRVNQKQIQQISNITQRSAKIHVSKTLIQPSTTRSLVKSPLWTTNRLFQNSIVPGNLRSVD